MKLLRKYEARIQELEAVAEAARRVYASCDDPGEVYREHINILQAWKALGRALARLDGEG